jgi:hypothetical protein
MLSTFPADVKTGEKRTLQTEWVDKMLTMVELHCFKVKTERERNIQKTHNGVKSEH